jgi:microcystin-dependent protein
MAQHNHLVNGMDVAPDAGNSGHTPANTKLLSQAKANVSGTLNDVNLYGIGSPSKTFAPSVNPTGGSQAHENQQPYLVLNFCIALQGIFPSRT